MIEQLTTLYKKVFGTHSDRVLKKFQPLLQKVNALESQMQKLSDEELQAWTPKLQEKLQNGASTDEILPEAFAVTREAAVRVLGMRHYDVQILGGIVLHRGMVAEMKTGEGKTLCATLPVYLNALTGKGVHVITVNDYLASRDADWMGEIYRFLGLSVGKVLSSERNSHIKKAAYACDITYGTNNEFGFDYLRDNMKFSIDDYVQREHHFAIVDEVDSILIDEARTPLIISGPAESNVENYNIVDSVIPTLQADIDYIVDEKSRSVTFTDIGVDKIEQKLGVGNLYDTRNMEVLHHVDQALKAHTLFKRNRDYVVKENQVIIVDEHTGRLMPGRRWSDGLHQAIEAKERVEVQSESQTYASITYQNYFRMYEKLAGMTGTAETEEEEFRKIYNLDVVVVPTNKPVIREDMDDIIFKTTEEKIRAVLKEIQSAHEKGQPILVGTTSVEKSDLVSRMMKSQGIQHEVLNAKNHSREAEIVSQAGRLGAVTVSTNMAGRGTDIKLGGDPEAMAKLEANPDENPAGYEAALEKFKIQCAEEKQKVLDIGGLYIIGTERHESRRIDNQLRGRSGRQGDPGRSRFYLCFQDDLLRIFGSDKLIGWYERMGMKDDEPIEHSWVTSQIESAQKKVEGHNFNMRKNLLEYDDVMNLQRTSIYEMRRKALKGEGIREMIVEAMRALVDDIISKNMDPDVRPEEWDLDEFRKDIQQVFAVDFEAGNEEIRDMAFDEIRGILEDLVLQRYEEKESIDSETIHSLEQMLLLELTDQYWKDHLLAMDRLRDGIGLRGYGQQNPLLEYKREGTDMFMMMSSLRDEAVVTRILRLEEDQIKQIQDNQRMQGQSKFLAKAITKNTDPVHILGSNVPAGFTAPSSEELQEIAQQRKFAEERQRMMEQARQEAEQRMLLEQARLQELEANRPQQGLEAKEYGLTHEISKNDPCPCGSEKKFKKCCLKAV